MYFWAGFHLAPYKSKMQRVLKKLLDLVLTNPAFENGMPLQLCGICLYSLSYTSAFFPNIVTISQVLADRALKARLRQVEQFSDGGLPFKDLDMSSTKELFGNYLATPNPLNVNELVHLKLIAVSLSNFFKKRGVKANR